MKEAITGAMRNLTRVFLVAAGVLLALALYSRVHGPSRPTSSATLVGSSDSKVDGRGGSKFYHLALDGNRRGPDDAAVTIIVFSNYGCSHCASFERTLEALMKRYPDQLLIVTKHFEPTGHLVAARVEEAADCAALQGKFEAYHGAYFSSSHLTISREPWLAVAQGIGIPDSAAFVNCVRSGERAESVSKQTAEALALEINATPTSFVNGIMLVGDVPFKMMDQIVAKGLRGRLSTTIDGPSGPATSYSAK